MRFLRNRSDALLLLAGLICAAIVALAVAGAVVNYSPVPNADMWNGAIGFVLDVDEGKYAAWWAQHNEHRILLSRLFFWLDIKFFGGVGVFLIAINYLLVACSLFVFYLFVDKLHKKQNEALPEGRFMLLLVITSFLFLWSQEGNLEWAFQCHFFLAQLLPLCALYYLAKNVESGRPRDFAVACLFGGSSVWALANGVLILPIMILYSVVFASGIKRISCLALLTFVMVAAYFYDYHSPEYHGHLLETIKNSPWDLLHYTMLYLGGVAYYIFGQEDLSKSLALLAGMILTSFTIFAICMQLKKSNKDPFVLGLIFFIIYIGGTAFGAGGSRLIFGMDQALSSRYTTPSNMAWAALIVVVWHERYLASLRRFFSLLATVLMSVMLVFQFTALKPAHEAIANREVAALASALDINDAEYIRNIFPNPVYVLDVAKLAIESNYSIFTRYPYKGLSQEIGKQYDVGQRSSCIGSLERVIPLPVASDYVQVHGWFFDPSTKSSPKLIRFTSSDGTVVGFAVTGGVRDDVKNVIHRRAGTSGFTGYILYSQSGASIMASGDGPNCSMAFSVRSM